jgi:hypothetical protein
MSQILQQLGKSQLLSDVIDSVNVSSTLSETITLTDDINRSNQVLTRINDYVNQVLLAAAQASGQLALLPSQNMLKQALNDLPSRLSFVMQNMRNQTVQSAGGYKITAMLMGEETKLYSALNMLDTYANMLLDIPQAIAKRKATRYWNAALGIEPPSEKDILVMWRNGFVKSDYLLDYYTGEGIASENAKNIIKIRDYQVGVPSLRDAWSMVKKGLKPEKFFYDLAMLGQGFSKETAQALFNLFNYDLSPSEVLRLADYVPLESSWVEEKLDYAGLNETDKQVYKAAIEKKPMRDEINKAWSLFLDSYQWGLFTQSELTTFLNNAKFNSTEISWKIQTAELAKLKLRVKLMRDAEIYLYRKDVINENQLLLRLLNINIQKDIANAIVRNEAAKKGIDWEIED